MKVKLTIGLVLLTLASGGWWLYNDRAFIPKIHSPHSRPVIILDNVKEYSLVQLAQANNLMPDINHDWAADKTFIPPPVSYIRIEYLASEVEKPLSKIYVADQAFPYNVWIMEAVLVTKLPRMQQLLYTTNKLPCALDSGSSEAGADQFEILLRSGKGPLKRCLISFEAGCKYIHSIGKLPRADLIGDPSYPLSELVGLEHRIECPKPLFEFGPVSWTPKHRASPA